MRRVGDLHQSSQMHLLFNYYAYSIIITYLLSYRIILFYCFIYYIHYYLAYLNYFILLLNSVILFCLCYLYETEKSHISHELS